MSLTSVELDLVARFGRCTSEDGLLSVIEDHLQTLPRVHDASARQECGRLHVVEWPPDQPVPEEGPISVTVKVDGRQLRRYLVPLRVGDTLHGALAADVAEPISELVRMHFRAAALLAAPYFARFAMLRWAHLSPEASDGEIREEHLRRARLAELVDKSDDFIGYSDADGRIEYINPAGLELLGHPEGPMPDRIDQCHPPEEIVRIWREVFPAATAEGSWTGNSRLVTPGGDVPIRMSLMALKGHRNVPIAFVARMTLLSETDRDNEKLSRYAYQDSLTEVPNRRALEERLEDYFADASVHTVTFVLFDLDGFKAINDTHGHPVGDEILRIVAARVQTVLRKNDAFGRLGGDEFAVILRNTSLPAARALARRIGAVVREPLAVDRQRSPSEEDREGDRILIHLSASIGIAREPVARDDTQAATERLYHAADRALYSAKKRGRTVHVAEIGE